MLTVAHVADEGYGQLEVPCALEKMVPLLRNPSDNWHATLVTMLGKAVRDNITNEDRLATEGPYGTAAQIIRQYLDTSVPMSMDDPMTVKIMYALDCVLNHDPAIKRYLKKFGIFQKADEARVQMKKEHIVGSGGRSLCSFDLASPVSRRISTARSVEVF
ncbi:hypothetical protein CGCA056_v004261 [Colletotrichum aenigma]|uniref:uncharacterized protein n=1 Tax=Colletotrichum aenigma TaxID=1215731 RepID=UPI00187269F2|nr:uncharacterized protein CGCA056_v004261 [Colletotrichum aenigma]KAF5524465.1 hypothetical protein CGCA056_v004261 [Colletotrichum aenigma]